MINNIAELMADLEYIGKKVHTTTTVYLISGAAWMHHRMKDSTKDVDICCDYEETNRIVAALRSHGRMETVTGIGNNMFLRFFLKNFTLEIFVHDVWCGDEYALLQEAHCEDLIFGNVTFKVPDAKTLLKIKDNHIQCLCNDWKELKEEKSV